MQAHIRSGRHDMYVHAGYLIKHSDLHAVNGISHVLVGFQPPSLRGALGGTEGVQRGAEF